ncbi:MAG: UDP-N-acetylmuramate dehydrogenase [Ekhidna sp.]|nr:UDP-N-acetylmuramate dehydrogenase [Ekhidna sp.]MBC6411171.1 UDP-N-acetylmuramate dehydrogenase [Ekhidna sp.]MBC6425758.1 UDP-N-acetylmuramate dehydrogenase [Ekhidna sp.]
MIVQQNVSLKPYNTFGIDENAGFLAIVDSTDDLDEIFGSGSFRSQRKMILGGGSNVLFTRGFTGVVVKNEIKGIHIFKESDAEVFVSVGAGENWHQFVLWSVERGFGGVENLSLIPGTVGAAPMQNIGAYGTELREVFHSLEAYEIKSGKLITFYKEDCRFDYRYSVFKGELKDQFVIIKVNLRLKKNPEFNLSYKGVQEALTQMGVSTPTLKNVSQAIINIRHSKLPDPVDIGNAGSFFKHPVIEKLHFEALEAQFPDVKSYPVDADSVKIPAGWLIERAGWKGYKAGEFGVHDKQALVLINLGNARGRDIFKLSNQIQKSVQQQFGIELEREVNVI